MNVSDFCVDCGDFRGIVGDFFWWPEIVVGNGGLRWFGRGDFLTQVVIFCGGGGIGGRRWWSTGVR